MASYHLALLGRPTFQGPRGFIQIPGVKVQALFWFLAAQPRKSFSRSQLGGLLWENHSEPDARNNLSTTLARLRRALPFWPVSAVGDDLGWDPGADVTVDIHELLAAITAKTSARLAAREAAVNLYRGPFLDGVRVPDNESYDQWLEEERHCWEVRILKVLHELILTEEATGAWDSVIRYCRQGLSLDPLQERFHRYLMSAYYHSGNRAAALGQYAICQQAMRENLDVDPEPETTALRDAILKGEMPHPPVVAQMPISVDPPSPAPAAPSPPLVGRAVEMAQIEQSLARVAASEGRVVILHGEVGIGKSRLVDEVVWRIRQSDAALPCQTLLLGHCYPTTQGLPFGPMIEALGTLLPTLNLAGIGLPDLWLAEVSRLLPDLAIMRPNLPPPQQTAAPLQRHRLFEGVARFLASLPPPVLLVMEDIHWADEETLLLLDYLIRHPLAREISFLISARSGDLSEKTGEILHQWQREGRLTWLEIGYLTPSETRLLVATVAGSSAVPLSQWLHGETKGNPLFILEVLRSLQENDRRDWAHLHSLPELTVPESFTTIASIRLTNLPQPTRAVLAAAAIFPQGAPFELIQQVSGLDESPTLNALETLVEMGVLEEACQRFSGAGGCPTRVLITFTHDLVRRAVHSSLSQARLQTLHRRAFRYLQTTASDFSVPPAEQLAHHTYFAGMWEQALSWNRIAAASAEEALAFPTAALHLERALECLGQFPPSPERFRQSVAVRLQLGALGHCYDPVRLSRWLEPARAEAKHVGDESLQRQVLLAQSAALTVLGESGKASPLLEQILTFSRETGDATLQGQSALISALLEVTRGDCARALKLVDEAAPVWERSGSAALLTLARSLQSLAWAALGDFDRAEAAGKVLARDTRKVRNPALAGQALGTVAHVAFQRGKWREAAATARAAALQARAGKHILLEYVASIPSGLSLARTGDAPGGVESLQAAMALAQRAGTQILLDRVYASLAEIRLEQGLIPEAEAAARTGLTLSATNGLRFGQALCRRVLGQIAAAKGSPVLARGLLLSSLEAFSALRALPEMARCHAQLAAVMETEPDRARSRQQAEHLFRKLAMIWDLERLLAGKPCLHGNSSLRAGTLSSIG